MIFGLIYRTSDKTREREISTAYHRNGLVNEKDYALERLARREKGVLRAAHTYTAIICEYPPPRGGGGAKCRTFPVRASEPRNGVDTYVVKHLMLSRILLEIHYKPTIIYS